MKKSARYMKELGIPNTHETFPDQSPDKAVSTSDDGHPRGSKRPHGKHPRGGYPRGGKHPRGGYSRGGGHPNMPPSPHRKPPSASREYASLAIKIGVIALVLTVVFTFVYGFHRNNEPGMIPTVRDGDLILYHRLSRTFSVGDLILLDFQGQSQIRRVVAIAGDVVDITESGWTVNGAPPAEPYIFRPVVRYEEGIEFPHTVGVGQVFVLGDAREVATDSRIYGSVYTRDIRGRAITIIRRRNL